MSARRWLRRRARACLAGLALHAQVAVAQTPLEPALQPAMLAVTVNDTVFSEPLLFLRGADGSFYVTEETVRNWRLAPLRSAHQVVFEGKVWLKLNSDSGIQFDYSEQTQALEVRAHPSLFADQQLAWEPRALTAMTEPGAGFFANYDAILEHGSDALSGAGSLELVGFTSKGIGATNFVGRFDRTGTNIIRLETNWTVDRPDRMMSVRIGDTIARGGSSMTPVRLGGIQIARNFDVQPGFVTLPLPTIDGSAALPSVAEVYVDSVLRDSRAVEPGPFTLLEAPVRTGGGTVQLVTRDLLGREFVTSQRYYTSAALLRRGLHDFSYEAGFLRHNFGMKSSNYGRFVMSAVHRYGLTSKVTIEGSARLSSKSRTGAAGVTATVFDLAQFNGSAALSHSGEGVGTAVAAGLERRSRGLSLGVRTEVRSGRYLQDGERYDRRTRHIAEAFADVETRWGSIGINYYRRANRDRGSESLVGVNANIRTGSTTSLQLYARRAASGERQTTFGAFLAMSLGSRQSASASVESQDGRLGARYALQKDLPAGIGNGFQTAVEIGRTKSLNFKFLHNGRWGWYGAEVARQGSNNGVRLSAAGSVGFLEGSAFAARRLGTSFGQVRVGRRAGVRVYADDNLVGVTGHDGRLIIPDLRAYDLNSVRIDDADLPITTRVDAFEAVVRPYARTGTIIRFNVEEEQGALLRLLLESGEPVPAGAQVEVEGKKMPFSVSAGGELYVAGLRGEKRLIAKWSNGRCQLSVAVAEGTDPQPSLGPLLCKAERHAAR